MPEDVILELYGCHIFLIFLFCCSFYFFPSKYCSSSGWALQEDLGGIENMDYEFATTSHKWGHILYILVFVVEYKIIGCAQL